MKVQSVLETAIYADDLEKAEKFYTDVLGLELFERQAGRHVFFRCGESMFLIFKAEATLAPDALFPPHGAHGPGHVAFAVSMSSLPAWKERLERNGVRIEKDFKWPNGGRSLYFRDPAGNSVELASPLIWNIAASRQQ
jgi:catechol 2,3-dioxygenase-like lactoylglutathione lyase family enzyme